MTNTNPVRNTSLAQPTKFQVSFSRLPGLVYFIQAPNIPGVTITDIPRHTPFVDLYVPGEKLVYDTWNITFLIDEDLRGWQEIHDWMRGLTFPEKFDEYRKLLRDHRGGGIYSDATMTINSNANTPILRVHMKDCFPISLSTIQYDSTQDAGSTMVGDASFRFSYHSIERLATT